MNLIPEFKIGLWNGWILSAIFIIANYSFMFIGPKENVKEIMDQMKRVTKKEKLFNSLYMILYMGIIVYSIFVSLKLGSSWFYTGLVIFALGIIGIVISGAQLFFKKQGQLMTKGFYRFSRNPQYVIGSNVYIGIGIATASWVILIVTVFLIILTHFIILGEERSCLEKYGDSYRDYINRTARYIGIPKK